MTEHAIRAKHIISTLPLGCLQDNIAPGATRNECQQHCMFPTDFFSKEKVEAIKSLGSAVMDKVAIAFEEKWWPDSMEILNMISGQESYPTWHVWPSFHVENFIDPDAYETGCVTGNLLLCYLTGAFAEAMELKSDEEVMRSCMEFLRKSFKQDAFGIPDPIGFRMTRWRLDPYSRGSWTILPKDAKMEHISELRQPSLFGESSTFLFAGEHTCDGRNNLALENGTVHGAWLSGELAGKAVAKLLGEETNLEVGINLEYSDSDESNKRDSDSDSPDSAQCCGSFCHECT